LPQSALMQIILGSASPYRGELLARLGLPFLQRAAQVDETPIAGEHPAALAQRLAAAKARAVGAGCCGAIVLGSDQTAECGDLLLGKPGNFAKAREQLRQLSGRSARFHTAVALLDTRSDRLLGDLAVTEVRFRPLSEAEIDAYLHRESPYDCAGSFKAEGVGIALFDAIHSDDPTALIGLSLIRVRRLLQELGVAVL